jgi:hypothetical protein
MRRIKTSFRNGVFGNAGMKRSMSLPVSFMNTMKQSDVCRSGFEGS